MEYLLTRLDDKISSLNKTSKKALVAYLVAGDPDLDSTLELMHGFVNAGVDILEIGVPFTDPIAEGPIIQAAHDRALKNNTSLTDIFWLVEKFRKDNTETPIILMGYMNTFLANSHAFTEAHCSGSDAVLIVDVPGESNLEALKYSDQKYQLPSYRYQVPLKLVNLIYRLQKIGILPSCL